MRYLGLGLLAALAGCATHRVVPDDALAPDVIQPAGAPPLVRVGEPRGLAVAREAEDFLQNDRRLVRRDCSGLVESVFQRLGLMVPEADDMGLHSSVASTYHALELDHALYVDHPLPGDLAFFDDTYDRNHNGRLDDPLTHVAIVVSSEEDGTLTLVHYGGHGISSFHMNLSHVHQARDGRGKRVNDVLRPRKRRDSSDTRHLASELFVAFGRAAEVKPELATAP